MKLTLLVIGCLSAALVVSAQAPPPEQPDGVPPPQVDSRRVVRQAMPLPMPDLGAMNPMNNMGMQGLGNIPDPTAVVAKIQEVGKQFLGGRRRRQATTTMPVDV